MRRWEIFLAVLFLVASEGCADLMRRIRRTSFL
jgi:hypothetical protein